METLALYLVKCGALIALFYSAYYFLLRKETFFVSNRWYLLLGLVTSVMLPLVTYRKIVWIDALPASVDWKNLPYVTVVNQAQPGFEIDWMLVAAGIYAIGIFAFLFRFMMDFRSLRKALDGNPVMRQADFRFVDTNDKIAPFSYFNYIVYNSSLYNENELANIIEHEKVHSNQNHTMDVLFARFFCIVFWFNPFVWLYKKAMLQNLEFIADSEAMKKIEDKKSYQITLLKVTTHENCVDVTNHFYQSLIKKRIVMLNKNQSKKRNSWKYFLIVPLLAAFMVYFQVKVVAQEKAAPEAVMQNGTKFILDKNTTDAEMKSEVERLKKDHGVTLKCSKVKRNGAGEIVAIKMTYKDANGKKGTTQVSGDEPIQPICFYKNDDAIGFKSGSGRRDVQVVGVGESDNDGPGGQFSFSFDNDDSVGEAPEAPEPPEAPEAPEAAEAPEAPEPPEAPDAMYWTKGDKNIVIKKNKSGGPVVIIDGKIVSDVDVDKIMADIGPIVVDGKDVMKGKAYNYSYNGNGKGKTIVINTGKIRSDAMKKAMKQMDKSRAEMDKQIPEMDRQREVMRKQADEQRNNEEMQQAKAQMDEARQQLQQAKAELDKTRAEMKAEIEQAKAARK